MAMQTDVPPLGSRVRVLLRQLRRRIRMYVLVEGVLLAVLWLALTFWLGLAIDYLPVLVGASEMPREARAVLLAIIGMILAYVIYRWILRRTLARLPDHSMAVLLERRFRTFHDGLVTTVELAERPTHAAGFNSQMLQTTASQAESLTDQVRVGDVFRWRPLAMKALMSVVLVGPIVGLYAVNGAAVEIWMNRLYLLKDDPWPRSTHVEVVGIQVQRTDPHDGSVVLGPLIEFPANREIKVAKGSSVIVQAQADATKVLPEFCTIYYRTDEDQSGHVSMPKHGHIRDEQQPYAFDGKPFRGILSDVTFDVRGRDHRVRDYRLKVVTSPAIVDTQLECTFPQYMVNQELSLWLPRTIALTGGTQLPNGTRVVVRVQTNKDLVRAEVYNPATDETTTLKLDAQATDRRTVEYVVPALEDVLTLEWTLHDTDGVANDPPYIMTVAGVEDQSPTVDVALSGIGTSVTPSVIIPVQGQVEDDYDVAETWFEVVQNDGGPRKFPFAVDESGRVAAQLDFRELRSRADGGMQIEPNDKLSVVIKAADQYNLGDAANVGTGDRYQLDVVTPDELLAQLERRELGLRRRFEQIIDEVNQMRDALDQIRRRGGNPLAKAPEDSPRPSEGAAPDNKPDNPDGDAASDDERAQSLRLLYAQRAVMQSQKSAQEILGVAASFDDIRQELINNRVDTEDRKIRLKDQIADPLKKVGKEMFADLDLLLQQLEAALRAEKMADEQTTAAVEQTDDILIELDKILQKMLELETYNELINIVRSLLEEQKQISEKTKKERVKQVRDLLK